MGEIRYGTVSSVNPKLMTARVVFRDKDDMVSADLPVIVPNSLKNKDYQLPDIGEKIVCAFLDNGSSQGFILGSVYDQSNLPLENDPDIRSVKFEDGTVIKYNRQTKTFTLDCNGRVDVIAANNINISGDVNITGKLNVSGDAQISGISFTNHVHSGVQSGGGNTSTPK